MSSNHTLRPSEGGTVTRAAPCRAPLRRWERRAATHETLADLRLRPACRQNPGRFDRPRPMTAICAFPPAGVDVKPPSPMDVEESRFPMVARNCPALRPDRTSDFSNLKHAMQCDNWPRAEGFSRGTIEQSLPTVPAPRRSLAFPAWLKSL